MVKLTSLNSQNIAAVLKSGRRYPSRSLLVFVRRVDAGRQGRLAVIAPKRLGLAVRRNRCKRLLRAGFAQVAREEGSSIYDNYDIILMATERTDQASSLQLADELKRVFAKLVQDTPPPAEGN